MGFCHLAVGNLNVDIYMVVDKIPGPDERATAEEAYVGPGGAAANYAVAAARLGHLTELVAHTGVLAERLGVLERLREAGVGLSHIVVHEDEFPGIVVVAVGPGGERAMIALRGANRHLRGDEAAGAHCEALHVASRGPEVLEAAASSVEAGLVSYDPGFSTLRRDPGGVLEAARRWAHVLFLNRAEYGLVAPGAPVEDAARLLGGRLRVVVVKLGGEGAVAATRDCVCRVEAYRVERVVDTTGAGDVFAAAFNVYLLEKGSIEEALRAASAAAGLKVSRRGGQAAPSREEVEEALRRSPPRVWRL